MSKTTTFDREAYEAERHRMRGAGPNTPEIGAIRKCLVCALDKPWAIYDTVTGATVCADCRDARAQLAAKDAEIERLREALEQIALLEDETNAAGREARRALTGPQP